MGQTETVVKSELAQFIKQHTGQDALNVIDEIVLSYVVGIVESLFIDDDASQDLFDVDQFSEMMAAYIPSFANINCKAITEWMLKLSASLDTKTKIGSISDTIFKPHSESKPIEPAFMSKYNSTINVTVDSKAINSQGSKRSRSRSSSSQSDDERVVNRLIMESNSGSPQSTKSHMLTLQQQGLELLSEMFPHLTMVELQRTLAVAAGDCQKAAQLLLLHKGELLPDGTTHSSSGFVSSPPIWNSRNRTISSGSNDLEEDYLQDKQLREQILNKYAYIDQDDDVREHRPVAPKPEPKKLIRYRDNKIVSVKGERYSEVKSDNPEDMGKTFVSLKPARQYRFH